METRRNPSQSQGQRYFVERSFQDGKSHLGMGHDEARHWRSWHHHMEMVGLAMHFTFLEREALKDESPLLSVRDIVEFIGRWFVAGLTQAQRVPRIAEGHHRRRKQMLLKITSRREMAGKQLIKVELNSAIPLQDLNDPTLVNAVCINNLKYAIATGSDGRSYLLVPLFY